MNAQIFSEQNTPTQHSNYQKAELIHYRCKSLQDCLATFVMDTLFTLATFAWNKQLKLNFELKSLSYKSDFNTDCPFRESDQES